MGQSTPAPASNKVAAQLRFDTPLPSTTVKTVPTMTMPVAATKPSSAAAGRTTAGES